MTLRQWKQAQKIPWHEVARRLGVTQNRIWALMRGAQPKGDEKPALWRMTDNEVLEFTE